MELKVLKDEKIKDFIKYCKIHRTEIDESFLYDEDLKKFTINKENPTYIITDKKEKIIASASLIMDDYYKRGKKGRFRIFHSGINDIKYYKILMDAILKHTDDLEKIIIFIPDININLKECIKKLDFSVERHSSLFIRENLKICEYNLKKDYHIKIFRPGVDEKIWCEVRNDGFKKLKGNETPIIPKMVKKMISGSDYIKDGLMILYHKEKPIGIIRGAYDEYEGEPILNIGPFAIISEYQNKGLGRSLLREILNFAKKKHFKRTILCVNGENERAKSLYIQEGFKEVEAVTCYGYDLK